MRIWQLLALSQNPSLTSGSLLSGVKKRTSLVGVVMSANDPQRTSACLAIAVAT